ncbi:hypothetical protein PTRA_a1309 [Pseudoalteromonas translucida KMM 520]|uniref:Uncharacterized protein n=1 Tax=Pseudoalteromonas translucida KMM 520 TaxID=1315283 RepID=A0A0U2V3Y8_9GAMM|nr:hypothetical protein PTRA_a1309 [Pseudoalteromonas translucida KMM 520]
MSLDKISAQIATAQQGHVKNAASGDKGGQHKGGANLDFSHHD